MKNSKSLLWLTGSVFLLSVAGCEPGGVGDPCIPEDEYRGDFPGYGIQEVNIESRSFQCETRICLVNHFQGRVSCPYGQQEAECCAANPPPRCTDPEQRSGIEAAHCERCQLPNQEETVALAVLPQFQDRRAEKAVYCSCRCDGPDKNARYCECPQGYSCTELVDNLGLGRGQLAGSYCVKSGTEFIESEVPSMQVCRNAPDDCGPRNGPLDDD